MIPTTFDLEFFESRLLKDDAETEVTLDPTGTFPPASAPTRIPATAKPTRGQAEPTSIPPTRSSGANSFPTLSPKLTEAPTLSPASSQSQGGLGMQSYAIIALLAVGLIIALIFWRFCKAWKLRRERHMLRVQSTRVDAVLGDMQVSLSLFWPRTRCHQLIVLLSC